jgi:hypothetical protein
MACTTPILFLIFNRAELSARVFKKIREAKPCRLFIAADGPRKSLAGETELCQETRGIVDAMIDWPCEVYRLYRNENLGCQKAVSSAIDWFFSQVEEGIILEDDTLPHVSFFQYSETLLDRYRNCPDVMHISGNNFQFGRIRGNGAYYASRFAHSWGWATWRRAWSKYNISMPDFPHVWAEIASKCSLSQEISDWWKCNLEMAKAGQCNTWDYQWHYTIMNHQGICLIPNLNLVENIGVGIDATHMQGENIASTIHKNSLNWFGRPKELKICHEADAFDFQFALKNQRPPVLSFQEFFQKLKFQYYANKSR